MERSPVKRISSIIGNSLLSSDLCSSISSALEYPGLSFNSGNTVWKIFLNSLNAAIRDIENHPRGKLFRRLIEFGPPNPDEPKMLTSDHETFLSDPECAECVEFIYSHMVNRFKGELAELLALQPCIELIKSLQHKNHLPENVSLYWGNDIKEPRRLTYDRKYGVENWGGFSKGADGLLTQHLNDNHRNCIEIFGIIEIKSMQYSLNKVNKQISSHINRLRGGISLCDKIWPPEKVFITNQKTNPQTASDFIRIMVIPSSWKLSRKWEFRVKEDKRELVPPLLDRPPVPTKVEEIWTDMWKITLSWSEEALHQAAYEMTFWYMSQVGLHIYKNKPLPKGWENMTPEEAGYNAIKMMLYYIPLCDLSKRQHRKAIKLYNVYSFGFPLGVDSKEMLWPEDVAVHSQCKFTLY
jgi:hypothetical protein